MCLHLHLHAPQQHTRAWALAYRSPCCAGRPADPPPPQPAAGKGGKNRRRGKNDSDDKRELIFKEDGQEYAQVLRMLGNGRLEAHCMDGVKRLCHIRGKMRKKVRRAWGGGPGCDGGHRGDSRAAAGGQCPANGEQAAPSQQGVGIACRPPRRLTAAPSLLRLPQVWVSTGDIVLVGLRDYQDEKADVILK